MERFGLSRLRGPSVDVTFTRSDVSTHAEHSPLTPPRSRRKVRSPTNWVAGAVRILKKGERSEQSEENMQDVGITTRFGVLENAIFLLGTKLDEFGNTSRLRAIEKAHDNSEAKLDDLSKKFENAAAAFDHRTITSLKQNEALLWNVLDRMSNLELEVEKLRGHTFIEYPNQSDRIASVVQELDKMKANLKINESEKLTKNLASLETELKAMSKQVHSLSESLAKPDLGNEFGEQIEQVRLEVKEQIDSLKWNLDQITNEPVEFWDRQERFESSVTDRLDNLAHELVELRSGAGSAQTSVRDRLRQQVKEFFPEPIAAFTSEESKKHWNSGAESLVRHMIGQFKLKSSEETIKELRRMKDGLKKCDEGLYRRNLEICRRLVESILEG